MSGIMNCGVYRLTCRATGKSYVGSSKNIAKRFTAHRRDLRAGIHKNAHLLNAWNLHGAEAFEFVVLLVCEPRMLVAYEQSVMDAMQAHDKKFGYNICAKAYSTLGVPASEKSKIANSLRCKGKPNPVLAARLSTPEGKSTSRDNILKVLANPIYAERNREAIRKKHADPEFKALMKAAQRKGKRIGRVVLDGREMCVTEAAEVSGVNRQAVYWRVDRLGMTHQQAFEKALSQLGSRP